MQMAQGGNIREFTSLVGSQKKKFLKGIPPRFNEFLRTDTCDTVKEIWTEFEEIYNLPTDPNGDPSEVLFPKSQAWINLFCSIRGIRQGYERPRVTPYMHLIPYHIPFFIKSHGSFKKFSGQGVEKNNDDAKRVSTELRLCNTGYEIPFFPDRVNFAAILNVL